MEDFKVEKDILNILLEDEEVIYAAQQSRVKGGGSFTTPDKVYITNYRVIFRDPSMLGLKKFVNDYHFKDISNVRMKKGILSTEIYLNSRFESDEVIISGLSHSDAETIVKLIRDGIYGNLSEKDKYESEYQEDTGDFLDKENEFSYTGNSIMTNEKISTSEEILSNLERLNELRKSNVITLEEFNIIKKRIIEENSSNLTNEEKKEDTPLEKPRYCKECGNTLDYVKEGEYKGDYVKFYKCSFCNKTYAKKIE